MKVQPKGNERNRCNVQKCKHKPYKDSNLCYQHLKELAPSWLEDEVKDE